jgi:hypothetical protein
VELREASRDVVNAPAEGEQNGARAGSRGRQRAQRPNGQPAASTRGGALKMAGRLVLWGTVLLIVVRGAGDLFAGGSQDSSPATAVVATRGWPHDEARAFAVDFARAYLTFAPEHPDYHALALRPFLASELQESAGLEIPESGPTQTVEQATVARGEPLDARRALVTVAATVANRTVTTRYLTVPVARDDRGGLAVYDYPSFTAPPARADVEPEETERLEGRDQREIEDVLSRFFAAYLAGREQDLPYFLPTGVSLGALDQRYELRELISAAQVGDGQERRRTVLTTLRARDVETNAVHVLRYRVGLERRDRWYVAAVNQRR